MSTKEHIWVIDDDQSIRWVLEKALTQANMEVTCFKSAAGILDRLSQEQPDAIVTDIRMPGMDGLALLEQIKERGVFIVLDSRVVDTLLAIPI